MTGKIRTEAQDKEDHRTHCILTAPHSAIDQVSVTRTQRTHLAVAGAHSLVSASLYPIMTLRTIFHQWLGGAL